MQGSRTLAVTVQQAWEALNDPAILRECIPGCERFEATEPGAYAVAAAMAVENATTVPKRVFVSC